MIIIPEVKSNYHLKMLWKKWRVILEQISNLNVEVKSMKDEFLNMKDVIIKRSRCIKFSR